MPEGTRPPFVAGILAGGRSTRMGSNKATILVEGRTLLERQVALVRTLAPAEILISVRASGPRVPAGTRAVPDGVQDQGPLAGICALLRAAAGRPLLVLAVDMAGMTGPVLAHLLDRSASGQSFLPRSARGWEPLAGVYHPTLLPLLEESLGSGRPALHPILDRGVGQGLVEAWDIPDGGLPAFSNWNTPADLPPAVRAGLEERPRP